MREVGSYQHAVSFSEGPQVHLQVPCTDLPSSCMAMNVWLPESRLMTPVQQ